MKVEIVTLIMYFSFFFKVCIQYVLLSFSPSSRGKELIGKLPKLGKNWPDFQLGKVYSGNKLVVERNKKVGKLGFQTQFQSECVRMAQGFPRNAKQFSGLQLSALQFNSILTLSTQS